MKTIKVLGGGPLVGKTFYGIKEVVLERPNSTEMDISLRLDESPFLLSGDVRTFNIATGYLSEGGGETDLLRVDPKEIAELWFS